LFGRLRDDRVARRQRRAHLAQKDRKRKIPGADAGDTPRPCKDSSLRSPVGPGKTFRFAEFAARLAA